MSVIVRFAPSPTGKLHIGGARTALFNYIYAKQKGGKFILRIDDTDRERSKPSFEQDILDGLAWLGLKPDELFRQSDREEIYKQKLQKLLLADKAYQDGEAIRLRNPGQSVTFTDLIRGQVTFDTTDLGDFVIARNLGNPVYHFASVVDDLEMGITHVIRGEDHLSNTPRQILILEALGGSRPIYVHIPLILAPDRSKLSKRHGAVALADYRQQGYLPEALVNFLATLGWSPQTVVGLGKEFLTFDELIKYFSLDKVQKGGAIFNLEKLNWFNKQYLRRLPPREMLVALKAEYLDKRPRPSKTLLRTAEFLPVVAEKLALISDNDYTPERIKQALWDYATEIGRDKILWPLRVALTGEEQSPDPFTVAAALGKEETLARIDYAAKL